MVTLVRNDLEFILDQIKLSEQHATTEAPDGSPVAGTPLADLIVNPLLPYGVRTVDGTYNNIIPGRENWGAADQPFANLLPVVHGEGTAPTTPFDTNGPGPGGVISNTNYANPGSVVDTAPRTVSNLIVDQTAGNPSAVMAALRFAGLDEAAVATATPLIEAAWAPVADALDLARLTPTQPNLDAAAAAVDGFQSFMAATYSVEVSDNGSLVIPNVAPDEGISAPFNSWMTLFGQFFDHGLDLVPKGGNGTVFIPLNEDDPLYVPGGNSNFMVVTRSLPNAINVTTPFVDQNQTYTSHASHQVFLREYELDGSGRPVATGALLNGSADASGLPTWADVKAQALMLGIELTDKDVGNVPMLATDEYGRFLRGPNGYAQLVVDTGGGNLILVEGTADGLDPSDVLALGGTVVRTGHAFLDDINDAAVPVVTGGVLQADADDAVGSSGQPLRDPLTGQRIAYDDELLDAHYITGDGRGNENIGLTAVHHVFHSEHNRLVDQIKSTVTGTGDLAFLNEWLDTAVTEIPTDLSTLDWNGERLFQAARFGTEMQYQHLVFEEFGRKVQPAIDLFVFNPTMDINPAIFAEFAHAVYRFGHSMLNETVDRLDNANESYDIGLIEAFLNPVEFSKGAGGATITAEEAAGAIVRGMTLQRGNAIDEYVTEALRNNLLGLPLDLAAINIARGREAGVPSLNEARAEFFAQTGVDWLKPYTNWIDFAQNLKHPESIINFIAAYGTHATITGATTLDAKRDAAMELIFGTDQNGDNIVPDADDRAAFLSGTGAYADGLGGLNNVDFWVGGLAEAIQPFGGMLGSSFAYVFEIQMEKLQNGDRFYYLSRTQGLNFLTELENNSFASIIKKNTALGDENAPHIPGEIFANVDYILEVDQARQVPGHVDPVHDNALLQILQPKVVRRDTDNDGDGDYLKFSGGEHVVLGGTNEDDVLIADLGDDTIWGDGGNDYIDGGHGINRLHGGAGNDIILDGGDPAFLHGEDGDDVISAGAGVGDLIFGGNGSDFIIAGFDAKEAFAGQGNDFVLGTPDVDFLLGNEGDDWLEGGEGFDTLAGDNSQLFFNSNIIGHDVLIAGTNENDFDAESGDDIMVQGESVMRSEGMLGFDWATFQGAQIDGYADMNIKIFTTVEADILRNRFDRVESLSGWDGNDTLIGDSRVPDTGPFNPGLPVNEQTFQGDELNAEGALRIAGLPELLGLTVEELEAMDPGAVVFAAGNILIGGGGRDTITGLGGNDIIDGDKWLSVRIGITAVVEGNTVEIGTADGMTTPVEIYPDFLAGFGDLAGKALTELMLTREVTPGQLKIVREILDGADGVDIAIYRGARSEYTITDPDADGFITITHNTLDDIINDGSDRVRNVEVLQFADEVVILDPTIVNTPATGLLSISIQNDTLLAGQINVGDTLRVGIENIVDLDGVPPISGFTFSWQVFDDVTSTWVALEDPITEAPITGSTLVLSDALLLDGLNLRVVGTFTGGNGIPEVVLSSETGPIIGLAPVVPDPAADLGIVTTGNVLTFNIADLLVNATDIDTPNNLLTVQNLVIRVRDTDPFFGELVDLGGGNFSFTPDPLFVGGVVLNFDVSDGVHLTPAEATLTVADPADGPEAVADAFVGTEDLQVTIAIADLLANDVPVGAGPLVAVNFGNAVGGILEVVGGDVIFTPDPDFFGLASFEYSVQEGPLTGLPGLVTIDIANVNDAPVAPASQDIVVDEDGITPFLLTGATDVDGDVLTGALKPGFEPTKGVVNFFGEVFEYIPNPDENGSDVFTIVISDGNGGETEQVVNVTITPINDAPVANSVSLITDEDVAVAGSLVALDVDGDTVTYAVVDNSVVGGTVTLNVNTGGFTFTPDANFNGIGGFQYVANDGTEDSFAETVTVDVAPINDVPVAAPVSLVTDEDTPVDGVVSATDADADGLTFAIVDGTVTGGTVVLDANTGAFTFTPDANFSGPASFQYVANDGTADSTPETVSIDVTPVNDAPVAAPVALVTDEDTAVSGVLSATDTENDTVTFSVVALSEVGGTVSLDANTGAFTFTPAANFSGQASFQYVANDGTTDSVPETVTIDVAPLNDTATAITLSNASVNEFATVGTAVGALLANDPDALDTLTFTLLDNAGGRFQLAGNTIQVANGVGLDFEQASSHTIRVSVSDGVGPAFEQDIVIAVNNVDPEVVIGTNAGERLHGGNLGDQIFALGGNDILVGGAGDDELSGGAGADNFVATRFDGADIIDGGTGLDRLSYSNVLSGVTVDLEAGTATGAEIGSDELSSIEAVNGTNLNDTILGDGNANTLMGLGGTDIIDGRGGNDTIMASIGDGSDTIIGGDGRDSYNLSQLSAGITINLTTGAGNGLQMGSDTISGIENLTGGSGNDTLIGDGEVNALNGGAGNDIIEGRGGNDNIFGGLGDDRLTGGGGADVINVADGNDTIVLATGYGSDRAVGFDADAAGGQDLIDLTAFGITAATFAGSVTITDTGADILVSVGGGNIRLLGVDGNGPNQVTIADFLLS